jgi:hypothetical protein
MNLMGMTFAIEWRSKLEAAEMLGKREKWVETGPFRN